MISRHMRVLLACTFLTISLCLPQTLRADGLKLALWNIELERKGPGLMLRDIAGGKDSQVEAALQMLIALDADVVVLAGFDYDHGLIAAERFSQRLAAIGPDYPHVFALRPNRGIATGLDLDLDGRKGGPGDAQGWGYFSGQAGMMILSKLPVDSENARDFSRFLWADLPGALWPAALPAQARGILRLSTTGHWEVPLILPDGSHLRLLLWHGSPPVFGPPGEVNARRNHDETAFWTALIEGRLPFTPPAPPFVVMGISNLDPVDGDGRHEAIRALTTHRAVQDPKPRADWVPEDPGHLGDSDLDTAAFPATGGLRTAVILPDAGQSLVSSGILRPSPDDPLADTAAAASRSFPIWVTLTIPPVASPPPAAQAGLSPVP